LDARGEVKHPPCPPSRRACSPLADAGRSGTGAVCRGTSAQRESCCRARARSPGSAGTPLLPWRFCRCFVGWSASRNKLESARAQRGLGARSVSCGCRRAVPCVAVATEHLAQRTERCFARNAPNARQTKQRQTIQCSSGVPALPAWALASPHAHRCRRPASLFLPPRYPSHSPGARAPSPARSSLTRAAKCTPAPGPRSRRPICRFDPRRWLSVCLRTTCLCPCGNARARRRASAASAHGALSPCRAPVLTLRLLPWPGW
jgi:hypothetical protein